MVKSMLDLRQLETFSHKKNSSSHEKDRQSVSTEVRMELSLAWGRWGVEQCSDDGHFLQPGNKAKRHQPRLSLHSCKGIRNPDGAVWDSEEKKDDAGLRDSRDRYPATPLGAPAFTLKRCFGQFVSVSVPHGFHRSLTAVKHQQSGGGGAGLQAAVEGHAQGQPGELQPRQRLLRERGQQGVQP